MARSVQCLAVNLLRAGTGIFLGILALIALAWVLFKAASIPSVHTISFDSYLSIMLTALGVMVATFAILVGLAAIWGYAGLKDYVREMAIKKVDEAMDAHLKKYPDATKMIATLERLREQADFIDRIRNQVVITPEPKSVANASKPVIQVDQSPVPADIAPATPLESTQEQVTPIEPWPGEEEADDNSDRDENE